ncbi:MAG: hypothetical protein ACTSVI_03635 [Promethearchaeota archaeon]
MELKNEELSVNKRNKNLSLEIAGAAVFIGISAILSAYITPILPRIPGWGIALIDPISIIWITCFLLFGWKSGFLCLGAGSLVLFIFDPTGIGPIFKFFATLPFMLIPTVIYFIKKRKLEDKTMFQEWTLKKKNYMISMLVAWPVRLGLMIVCNFILFTTIWASYLNFVTLSFIGLEQITAWTALTIGVIIINSWQTIFDVIFPYLLSFKVIERGIII